MRVSAFFHNALLTELKPSKGYVFQGQGHPARYAEMLDAIASQIPKLEKDLVKTIKEINDLPSKHSEEIEDYGKLIRIIDEKIKK